MSSFDDVQRYLKVEPEENLVRPLTTLQPIMAKEGRATIDLDRLREIISPVAELAPLQIVKSPAHWQEIVTGLKNVDAILPLSIPAYPTEVWNSHPEPLVRKGLPLIFWPLMNYDEPDFWRWSARDFLRALGVTVHIAKNTEHGLSLLKAYAVRKMLNRSSMIVFGEQNFPWNADAAGHLVTENLGTEIIVKSISDIRNRYESIGQKQIETVWQERQSRYEIKSVTAEELHRAVRVYLAVKSILVEEKAAAFGLNCFGDLVINGGRDVPCLAQCLLREDGYVTACDGDYIAMLSMMLITHMLDKPCMMSNMYPVKYIGALTDHFGEPLSPDRDMYPESTWNNLARLAHCGFAGIVSPEMTPSGRVVLTDWGGTYEIKRDGLGCGLDCVMAAGEPVTVVELCFDARTLLLAEAKICETTRHRDMPHCESSVLLEFRDLEGFVENISREHTAVVYGNYIDELKTLAGVLGLDCEIF